MKKHVSLLNYNCKSFGQLNTGECLWVCSPCCPDVLHWYVCWVPAWILTFWQSVKRLAFHCLWHADRPLWYNCLFYSEMWTRNGDDAKTNIHIRTGYWVCHGQKHHIMSLASCEYYTEMVVFPDHTCSYIAIAIHSFKKKSTLFQNYILNNRSTVIFSINCFDLSDKTIYWIIKPNFFSEECCLRDFRIKNRGLFQSEHLCVFYFKVIVWLPHCLKSLNIFLWMWNVHGYNVSSLYKSGI